VSFVATLEVAPRIQVEHYAIRNMLRHEARLMLQRAGICLAATIMIPVILAPLGFILPGIYFCSALFAPIALWRILAIRKRWRVELFLPNGEVEVMRASEEQFGPKLERIHKIAPDENADSDEAEAALALSCFWISFPLTAIQDLLYAARMLLAPVDELHTLFKRAAAKDESAPTLKELRELNGAPIGEAIRAAILLPGVNLVERSEGVVLTMNRSAKRRACGMSAE